MKLSDIKGDTAIDVLCDLIDPAVEIFADPEIAKSKNKPKLVLAKLAVKKHKKEVIEILAILAQTTPAEYTKRMNVASLIRDLMEVLTDEELTDFFSSQAESTEGNASGLHTVNTEAEGK